MSITEYVFDKNSFDDTSYALKKDFFAELRRRGIKPKDMAVDLDVNADFVSGVNNGNTHSILVVFSMMYFYFKEIELRCVDRDGVVLGVYKYAPMRERKYTEIREDLTTCITTWIEDSIREKFADETQSYSAIERMSGVRSTTIRGIIEKTKTTRTDLRTALRIFTSQHQRLTVRIDYNPE